MRHNQQTKRYDAKRTHERLKHLCAIPSIARRVRLRYNLPKRSRSLIR